jgi:glyoxylase-like metal-dependent hydrolase (beta-lactamase superfamily II)
METRLTLQGATQSGHTREFLMRTGSLIGKAQLAAVAVLAAHPAAAQERSAAYRSYVEARAVLDRGIVAVGGLEALRGIQTIAVDFEGEGFARNQSARPEPPYDRNPRRGSFVLDRSRDAARFVLEFEFRGNNPVRNLIVIRGDSAMGMDLVQRVATTAPGNTMTVVSRSRMPHFLLLQALDRAATLRSLGRATLDGVPHDVITFAAANGTQLTVHFDARTGLPAALEALNPDLVAGEGATMWRYSDWATVAGLKVPGRRVASIAGETTESIAYRNVRVNQPADDSLFQLPAGIPDLTDSIPQFAKVELAPGVWLLQELANGYNALAVGFKDHVMVVEPASSDAESRRAIAAVKELVPGKPIRYVVATHHHEDHTAGVRTYLAEGATLVTTPGNRRHFEKIAAAKRTIAPDSLSGRPRKPTFEMVTKRRSFSDGERTVELLDIGPSPHADEMLVAYLPREKLVFQADLFGIGWGAPIPASNPTSTHFAQRIRELGLDVERIASVHGRVATRAELEASLGKRLAAAD